MSAREWQPGDVGVVPATGERFMVTLGGLCAWASLSGDVRSGKPAPNDRPLATIDPESLEDRDRLCALVLRESIEAVLRTSIDDRAWSGISVAMQNALREFANPSPPKPDEPTAYLSAVVDSDGNRWHISGGPVDRDRRWYSPDLNKTRAYADIQAVRILSAGVES